MKKIKLNQDGFTLIGVLFVVLTLVIISIVGYFVAKHINKNTPEASTTNQSSVLTVNKLSGNQLPTDILQGLTDIWNKKTPGWQNAPASAACVGPGNTYYTVYEVNDTYAEAGLYCDSPSATLFVKVNGTWQAVQSTQSEFSCDIIAKYSIPKSLIAASDPDGAVCLNSLNQSQPIQ